MHAEGYAAGEMKHGPIALIDDAVPVLATAPSGPLFEKTVSNMEEVRARRADGADFGGISVEPRSLQGAVLISGSRKTPNANVMACDI